jgi:hypothetical protein
MVWGIWDLYDVGKKRCWQGDGIKITPEGN